MRTHPYAASGGARQRGFSLMELMVVLTLAGVIMGLAVPNFRDFVRNGRLTSASNDLLAAFTMARTEAIKRQLPVVVCASAAPDAYPPACSSSWTQSGGVTKGWIVWVDADNDWVPDVNATDPNDPTNEPVLLTHEAPDSSVTVRGNFSRVKYLNTGFSAPAAGGFNNTTNLALCDARGSGSGGNSGSLARVLRFTQTGRVRVSRDATDVSAAISVVGACP